jgi:hypothetical protein
MEQGYFFLNFIERMRLASFSEIINKIPEQAPTPKQRKDKRK